MANFRSDSLDTRLAQANLWSLIGSVADGLPRYVLSKRNKPEGDLQAIKHLSLTVVHMTLPVMRRAVKETQTKAAYECARVLQVLMADVSQTVIDSVAEEVINAGKSRQHLAD